MPAKVVANLDLGAVRNAVERGSKRALAAAADHLLTEANKHVPHDEGTLERSGATEVDEDGTRAAVYYTAPYAVRQHEDMTLHHTGKGEAKWLERTFSEEADMVQTIIASRLSDELD